MKNISKILLKGLLVIVLFTGASVVLTTMGVKTISSAHAAVSQDDVYKYLTNLHYSVYDMTPVENSEDWTCHTSKGGVNYITTVHVEECKIIDHEDIPM